MFGQQKEVRGFVGHCGHALPLEMHLCSCWRCIPALALPTRDMMLSHSETNCREILVVLGVLQAQGQIQGW